MKETEQLKQANQEGYDAGYLTGHCTGVLNSAYNLWMHKCNDAAEVVLINADDYEFIEMIADDCPEIYEYDFVRFVHKIAAKNQDLCKLCAKHLK